MRINSITRQSGMLATLLLLLTAAAEYLRMMLATPHAMEVAGCVASASWIWSACTVILLAVTGVIVGRTATQSGIFRNFCTLPIPIFGIVACGIFVSPDMYASSVAALCVAVGLSLFIRTLSRPDEKDSVFFGSMLFGIALLLYPPCIVFAALLPFMALISFQSWRKIIIAAIGYLLPFAAVSYIGWYFGGGIGDTADAIAEWFEPFRYATAHYHMHERFPVMATAVGAAIALLIIAGSILRRMDSGNTLVKVEKSTHIISAVLVLAAAAFAIPRCTVAILPVVAVPAAILAAATLDRIKVVTSTVIYWIILLLTAVHLFII